MKLYHYVHCPFCIRVRMALNFFKIDYESIVLAYDDEVTPMELSGKKMLPILEDSSWTSNESLKIIAKIDHENKLNSLEVIEQYSEIEKTLNLLGSNVHSLAMPYWIWSAEFNQESREYFQKKKEIKRGPFSLLVQNQQEFIVDLDKKLASLEKELNPFYKSNTFSLNDILIASHIWGMYVVPEFQFTTKIHNYLQQVKSICGFNYHEDYWRD